MRLATLSTGSSIVFGVVADAGLQDLSASGRWADLTALIGSETPASIAAAAVNAPVRPLAELTFLPPIPQPRKILCVGLNYHDHRAESNSTASAGPYPTIFTRFASSVVGHGVAIEAPKASTVFDYEGELAVVIGRACRGVDAAGALEYVGGYSCFQDGSIRDYQRHASQFIPGKNFDRSGSWGPWIVTPDEFDASAAQLTTTLNGQKVQDAPITDMIHSVADIIAYCSIFTELQPGDVIATGTPGGVGMARKPPLLMKAGDQLDIEITGIGVLSNHVVDEK